MKLRVLLLLCFALFFTSASAQLVINEVDYDQPSTDSSEFVELYNSSANAVLLSDYTLLFFNGNTASLALYDSITLPNVNLMPGAFFVVCGFSTGLVSPCDTSMYTTIGSGGRIQNAGSGGNTAPDAIAIRYNPTQTIIDAVSYEGSCPAPYTEGNGIVDTLSDNGVTAGISISRYPDGHDTQDNAADFFLVCSTPGATNCQPTALHSAGKELASLTMYPNPASSLVTIESKPSKIVSVSLKNILGKEVRHSASRGNKVSFDVSTLEVGVYLVFIHSDAGESTQRLMIRR